jgi:FKBP-type peptidyl-prolyl cis-trans isomerase 2
MLLLLAFSILILGCTGQTTKNGDNISVLYNVTDENGVLIDDNKGEPMTFMIGNGEVIEGFNYAALGMTIGETKQFTVTPEQGYGLYDASKLRMATIESMNDAGVNPENGTVVYGEINKNRERGVIINNNGTHVWIDFNHPLAGKTLMFNIELKSINTRAGNALG